MNGYLILQWALAQRRAPRRLSPYKEFRIHLVREARTCRSIAAQLGITVQYLALVFNGKRRGARLRERLVKECGVPAHLVQSKVGVSSDGRT